MHKNNLFAITISLLVFLNLFFFGAVLISQVVLKGESVTVPEITGKTMAEARSDLIKKDLTLSSRGTEFSDTVDKGLIINQDPPAGTPLRVTGAVKVVFSSGSRSVKVPDLIGKSLETCMSALHDSGLIRGYIAQIHTKRYPAGRVLAQKPDADAAADRNAPVNLLVSQGGQEDWFIMPDVTSKKATALIGQLKTSGFQVADVHYVYYPGVPSGVIVGQDPPSGYRIQKRSRISLEVSR